MNPLEAMFAPRPDGRRMLSMVSWGHSRTERWEENGKIILYHYEMGKPPKREVYRTREEFAAIAPELKCWSGLHMLEECECNYGDKTKTHADLLRRNQGMAESRWFLLPEYCEGGFGIGIYKGWHLYLRQRRDGTPNDDHDWGWIQYTETCFWLHRLLKTIDAPPMLSRHSYEIAEWFAKVFPQGLEVRPDVVPWPHDVAIVGEIPNFQRSFHFSQTG